MEVNFLDSIKNLLQFINNNWTIIIIIIGLAIAIIKKAKDFLSKSNDEKIEIAMKQIKETVLNLVSNAEMDYIEWTNAGAIKRSMVIEQIFEMYPVLSKVTNQDELIAWIDKAIDEALDTMRDIFEKNYENSNDDDK